MRPPGLIAACVFTGLAFLWSLLPRSFFPDYQPLRRLVRFPIFWLGLALFALPAAFGFAALIGPIFIYWLLVHVSGIPPLEAQMLASRGEAYAAYQRRVPAFFPSFTPPAPQPR